MEADSQQNEATSLASILVRISRECDVPLEHLRAEQLVAEVRAAWPGEESQRWSKWLREACESLALRCRITSLDADHAIELAQDGAVLVGAYRPQSGLTLLVGTNGTARQAVGEIDDLRPVSAEELEPTVDADNGSNTPWLVVEHPELHDANSARNLHDFPIRRLLQIVKPEWPDIWQILVFAFVAGVLSLATPIAVESLVNTVAFGQLLQPVFILALLLFGFLAFAGVMHALQTYVAEIIQRRLFTRVAADLAYRLPRVDRRHWTHEYGPELVNRFLDVVTLQKVVAKLLLDGVSIVLATLVGMTVLAFYHPWLLGFDVLLLLLIVAGLYILGRGGISSGIDESKVKYQLTAWLQDIVRCESGFKLHGGTEFAIDRANVITAKYLATRQQHFGILFRQIIYIVGLQAIAGTVLLGGGGWLVIRGQLSLGQLVAAELIVTTILASLAKLGKHLESFYDVVAAVDKLGVLLDLKVERHDGLLDLPADSGVEVKLTGVRAPVEGSALAGGLTDTVNPGERVALFGPADTGKSALLRMLFGLDAPAAGHVEVSGVDPLDLRPDVLRSHVTLVGEVELFEGTIAENIHLRRPGVGAAEARTALAAVGFLEEVLRLPDSLDTRITPSGHPLSRTQQELLMLARGIAGSPDLLLIDGVLDRIADTDAAVVMKALTSSDHTWTVLIATTRSDIAEQAERAIQLG